MARFQTRSKEDFATMAFDATVFEQQDFHPQLSLVTRTSRTESWTYLGLKRSIDLALALPMLAICLIPGLVIAVAISLSSEGPVFYRETRIGRGGRPFRIWKFRSMRQRGTSPGRIEALQPHALLMRLRVHKDLPDPRITPMGSFLRRWSLDELPQLLNVVRGDMSLIGPRPIVEAELPLYGHLEPFYLAATPGLSGLWQVSGRSNLSFAARAGLDASYVRYWSLRNDFWIMARTIPAVLGRVGAR
jgi:lipopolysaccharide/colanic/teichoic acid biosynthesis glycosyltransferase